VKTHPGGEPVGTTKTFEAHHITLGRGANNDWVLQDPYNHLSRNHCEITCANNAYTLIDNSKHGVFLNGASQKLGARGAKLKDGDRLALGAYELLVQLDSPVRRKPLRIGELDDAVPPPDIGEGNRIPKNWWELEGPEQPAAPRRPVTQYRDDGFKAFLEGAGIDPVEMSKVNTTAALRRVGETYRIAMEGLFELLKARDQFRGEFRMERTKIRAKGNNPLKFAPDAEGALLKMIVPEPGFLAAPDAMQEALKDIKADQVAMLAGIQVALTGLLAQIDPNKLKKRLEKRGLLTGLVRGGWKARSWELYEEIHAELARELADDFHGAFGKAFAEAYEAYVRRR
jgi:predicted component of type VI protein secretion system